MMYKLKSFFLLMSFVIMASCSNFLGEDPKGSWDKDGILVSMETLRNNAVFSIYNHVGGFETSKGLQGTGRGVYDLNTMTTDEAMTPIRGNDWYDGGFWEGLFLHKWGVNNKAIEDTWQYLFSTIMLCNEGLAQIEVYHYRNPETEVKHLIAEVRALRAMFYYYMMDLFGRVPLLLKSDVDNVDMVQAERSEITRFIFDELQEAAPLLNASRSNFAGEYYGRMTRPVVYFLLAKLALNAEIYMDDNWVDGIKRDGKDIRFMVDGEEMNAWETVVHYCNCIEDMGYVLEKDFASNFAVHNEVSQENIFVIPMDKHLFSNRFEYLFRSRHYNHGKAYGLSAENGASATIETLRVFGYDTDDVDNRFDDTFYYGPVFYPEDTPVYWDDGKTQLVYYPWQIALNLSGSKYEKVAGARMKKYEVELNAYDDGKLCDNDIVLFRYADVVLMKCEAKVRNGENGDTELNEVRARVGEDFRPATLSTILDERLLELAWEGWRRQDLIRFGQFTRAYSDRPQLKNEESGYTIVFPVPSSLVYMYDGFVQNYMY